MLITNSRHIVHMDLDCYFVSVSRLLNPKLVGKPVIVGGGERGVVAACSYETRVFGVHSAMPIKQAKRLCPDAIIIRGDYDEYSKRSDEITQIIQERVPLFERASIDEFYMDLSGMDKFFGCYQYATELRQRIIKETGLPISFGMSQNKVVSKVATDEAKPNNQMKIDYGEEKNFLAPLSVKKIPMVGEKTYRLLSSMGIEKVFTLQQMPPELLQNVLGENGISIWKKANGIDNTPVEPYNEQKSMSQEETFEQDTIDITKLKHILISMTEKLCFRLRSENKLTACVTVKIRYTNFDTHNIQCRISHTSIDHIIIPRVKELFDKLYNRRMMIRLVGVKFSHLVGGGYQINIFEDSEEMIQLYHAMDKMRFIYGEDKIQRAVSLNHSLRGFNPFNGINSSPTSQTNVETEHRLMPSIKSMNKLFNIKTKSLSQPSQQTNSNESNKNIPVKVCEYLLIINLPQQIKKEVMELKTKTGYDIKPNAYITLINFMMTEPEENKIIHGIDEVVNFHEPFEVMLNKFEHLKTHTLFLSVENISPIILLLRSLKEKLNLLSSRSFFSWKPHLTISKNLPEIEFNKAVQYFEQLTFDAKFIAQNILLMKHDGAYSSYETVKEFQLKQ
ncbi:MAG: DNA polymerase IV [Pseudomonadota bacterium]